MNLRERVGTLDESVNSVGRNFASKKKELLHNRKTAANLDQAIDTLQACLRVLDVVKRVRDMIKEGRYWSALRVRSILPSNINILPLHLSHLFASLLSPLTKSKLYHQMLFPKHLSTNIFSPPSLLYVPKLRTLLQRPFERVFLISEKPVLTLAS